MMKNKLLFSFFVIGIILVGLTFCQNYETKSQTSLQKEISKFILAVKQERPGRLEEDSTTNIIKILFCKHNNKPIIVMVDAVFYFRDKVDYAFIEDEYLVIYHVLDQACFDLLSKKTEFNKEILSNYSNERSENALNTVYENISRVFTVKNDSTLQFISNRFDFDCD